MMWRKAARDPASDSAVRGLHAELDAASMSGANGRAGASAGARTPRHPLAVARSVMETSPHVLLSGAGADRFAGERKHETMDPAWFVTPRRSEQLRKMKAKDDGAALDALGPDRKYGTVGCVAVDGEGHLAAGPSTGGLACMARGAGPWSGSLIRMGWLLVPAVGWSVPWRRMCPRTGMRKRHFSLRA